MLKAKKANRVLRIPEERAKDYAALGYTVTDMDGKVISKPDSPAETIKELKAELAKKDKRIAELEAQLGIDPENEAPEAGEDASGDAEPTDNQGEAENAEDEAPEAGDGDLEKKTEKAPVKKATSKK